MRILRKLLFLSIIVTLISSSIPFPYYLAAAQQIDEHTEQEAEIVFNDEEIDEVHLFESNSIESDILKSLDNGVIVSVLEIDDEFTLIEVVNDDEEKTSLIGYVLNDYIDMIIVEDEREDINDEPIVEEENDEEETEKSTEEDVIAEDKSESNDEQLSDEEQEEQKDEESSLNLASSQDEAQYGIALKNKTHVYLEQSRNSVVLRSYEPGTNLKFYPLNKDWYRATVKYEGEWTIGYIHTSDVGDKPNESQNTLQGIAIKNPTNVYETMSTKSKVLRNYAEGSILKYRTLNDSWYEATVSYNGKWTIGYIHKSDVENIDNKEINLEGIALRSQTNVYEKPSARSKALRNYAEGTVLKYRTFSPNWYIAKIKYNGKWTEGYIHTADVDNVTREETSLSGIALKSPTKIYKRASTNAGAHKSYEQGTVLKYKSLSKQWFEAVVYVNGKRQVGYIHNNDVENTVANQEQIEVWALKTPTNVYNRASRNATVIRNNYKKGQMLNVKTLSKNWYEAKVSYNGKWTTGYIHAEDISLVNAVYSEYNLTLNQAVDIQLKGRPQTDKKIAWVSKDYIKNNKVTASELNVRLGPDTSFKSVDKIKEDDIVKIVDEYNGWYAIEFNHNSQWTHATPKDVMNALDPQNYINDERQKFQFLDLSKSSGASVTVLNRFLNGKGTLSGQGKAFIDASTRHGVNDIYLLSHAILETGHGQSNLAKGLEVGLDKNNEPQLVTQNNKDTLTKIKTVYNMFGIRAFDSCPDSCGAAYAYTEGWDTPYKAIVGGAEFISSDYIQGINSEGTVLNTLYKMRWNPEFAANNGRYGKQYATDIGWAVKQVNTMYNLYQEIGDYKLVLDIPVYLK